MNVVRIFHFNPRARRIAVRLAQAAVLTMVFALTLHAGAEEREVRSRVAPTYPELAKRMKITGTVRISATIDADGKVTEAKAISGNKILSPAAEDAVKRWKFTAGTGTATTEVEVSFQ
jgi:TonB family protein